MHFLRILIPLCLHGALGDTGGTRNSFRDIEIVRAYEPDIETGGIVVRENDATGRRNAVEPMEQDLVRLPSRPDLVKFVIHLIAGTEIVFLIGSLYRYLSAPNSSN
jgi:hypothetical protein